MTVLNERPCSPCVFGFSECFAAASGGKLPPLSAANKRDYGNPKNVRWPHLSLVEKALISRARLYTNLVKISPNGLKPGQQFLPRVLRGHCVAFPHDAPYEFCKQLPNLDAAKRAVAVSFVGPDGLADRVFQACLRSSFLRVRPALVYWCVRVLCLLSPEYGDVELLETEDVTEAMRAIPAEVAAAGVVAGGELEAAVESVVSVDTAEVRLTHAFSDETETADDSEVQVALDPVLVAPREGVEINTGKSQEDFQNALPKDPATTTKPYSTAYILHHHEITTVDDSTPPRMPCNPPKLPRLHHKPSLPHRSTLHIPFCHGGNDLYKGFPLFFSLHGHSPFSSRQKSDITPTTNNGPKGKLCSAHFPLRLRK